MEPVHWMRCAFQADTEIEFDVRGGGCLRFGPGLAECRIGWGHPMYASPITGTPQDAEGPEEWGWIEATAEVCDRDGRVFRCVRPVSVYWLLLAAWQGCEVPYSKSFEMVVDKLQGVFERRGFELWFDSSQGAFAYDLRHSYATVSLGIDRTSVSYEKLIITVHEMENRGKDGGPTPTLTTTTGLASTLVLCPFLLDPFGWHDAKRPRSRFELTDRVAQPDRVVVYVE